MLYGKPVKLSDGRYFLKITTDDGARVLHQVNGVTCISPLSGKSVSFKTPNNFSVVDDELLTQAKVSKLEWFGKEVSDETVVSAFQKSVDPDGVLVASLVTSKDDVLTTAYTSQKEVVPLQDIPEGSVVDVLFELTGLVFSKRNFEAVWRVIQLRTKAPPKAPKFPKEYLFAEDGQETEEDDDPSSYL